MDFELNDEQKMFQRVVRDFCEAEVKPYAAEVDENAELHWTGIRKMADVGLLACKSRSSMGGADWIRSARHAIEEWGGRAARRRCRFGA